jgi:hypothetical protein
MRYANAETLSGAGNFVATIHASKWPDRVKMGGFLG